MDNDTVTPELGGVQLPATIEQAETFQSSHTGRDLRRLIPGRNPASDSQPHKRRARSLGRFSHGLPRPTSRPCPACLRTALRCHGNASNAVQDPSSPHRLAVAWPMRRHPSSGACSPGR